MSGILEVPENGLHPPQTMSSQQKPFTRKEAIKWATDMGDAYMPYRVVDVRANPIIFQSGEVKNV